MGCIHAKGKDLKINVVCTFDVLKKKTPFFFFSSSFSFGSNKQMPQASDFVCICDISITGTEVFVQMSLCLIIQRISSGRQSLAFDYVAIFLISAALLY